MLYESNGSKNICIIRNVITLQIILKNEILGNNNLFKVTSTYDIIKYGYNIVKYGYFLF